MKLKKTILISVGILLLSIILMVVNKDAVSEIHTYLTFIICVVVGYNLLNYFYFYANTRYTLPPVKYENIVFIITIPLLLIAIESVRENSQQATDIIGAILATMVLYFVVSRMFRLYTRFQRLQYEKAKAEISVLKNQINPHFFFNSLTTLYSLIKKDADKAQKYVLELSELMRFSVYEGAKSYVSIADEKRFLENYIHLNIERYQRDIDVKFDTDIVNHSAPITPLLLIILLENAFKHGAEKLIENAFININLKANPSKVKFSICNNFDEAEINSKPGIGLENLRNRLELSYPGNQHNFATKVENGVFCADLELTI